MTLPPPPQGSTAGRRRVRSGSVLVGVAVALIADPDLSLRAIAAQLEAMRERTPRGGWQWAASSVKHLLDRARRLGLKVHEPADG